LPEIASKEPPPIRFPPSQLFSTKWMTGRVGLLVVNEVRLVHGEITTIGSRWL